MIFVKGVRISLLQEPPTTPCPAPISANGKASCLAEALFLALPTYVSGRLKNGVLNFLTSTFLRGARRCCPHILICP